MSYHPVTDKQCLVGPRPPTCEILVETYNRHNGYAMESAEWQHVQWGVGRGFLCLVVSLLDVWLCFQFVRQQQYLQAGAVRHIFWHCFHVQRQSSCDLLLELFVLPLYVMVLNWVRPASILSVFTSLACGRMQLLSALVKEALIEIGCVVTSSVVGWLSRACTVAKRCILGL